MIRLRVRLSLDSTTAAALAICGIGLATLLATNGFTPIRGSLILFIVTLLALAAFRLMRGPNTFAIVPEFRRAVLVQALVQASVYCYWCIGDPMAREHLPFLFFQLCFAPIFYCLSCLLFGKACRPGFWLLAVVFSINFFIWFRPQFFWGQLALVMTAIWGKMFLTWERDGIRRHIFNPSGLVLSAGAVAIMVFSLGHDVLGNELVTSFFLLPRFGLFLFAVGCVTQWLPGAYPLPLGAVAFLIAASVLSETLAGRPLMVLTSHSSIFLGITLLITDPATTPRSPQARLAFGAAYGLSIAVAFAILAFFRQPSFYDKVLFVPVLNALAPWFERHFGEPVEDRGWSKSSRVKYLAAYLVVFLVFYFEFYSPQPGPYLLDLRAFFAGGAAG